MLLNDNIFLFPPPSVCRDINFNWTLHLSHGIYFQCTFWNTNVVWHIDGSESIYHLLEPPNIFSIIFIYIQHLFGKGIVGLAIFVFGIICLVIVYMPLRMLDCWYASVHSVQAYGNTCYAFVFRNCEYLQGCSTWSNSNSTSDCWPMRHALLLSCWTGGLNS